MDFIIHNFRNALAVLGDRPEWSELSDEIRDISRDEVLGIQAEYRDSGRRVPAGAQTAVNEVFRRRLIPLGWESEVPLFPPGNPELAGWTFDFGKKGGPAPGTKESFGVGVEITFNHAEAIAWTLIRLNLAGESTEVLPESKVGVGAAIYATREFKEWGRMDNSVGTFDRACLWLEKMKPVLPIPIAIVGLQPDWEPTDLFRGTSSGNRS